MDNKDEKKSLKMTKMLLDGYISKDKIEEILNIRSSTFYKYLVILKKCGFEIKKKNNDYKILNYNHEEQIQDFEYSLLAYLLTLSNTLLSHNEIKQFQNVISKISNLLNEGDLEYIRKKAEFYKTTLMNSYYREKMSIIDDFIRENKKIKIITKYGIEIAIFPKEFEWRKNKISLKYLDEEGKMHSIIIANIIKIIDENNKVHEFQAKETFFELSGKLSRSYMLKADERIVDKFDDKIIVSNSSADKTILFKRLLRYDTFCKVIFPKDDVLQFKNMVKKALANLDSI